MVLYNDKLAKLILWSGYHTITLGPFILTTKRTWEVSDELINHERIHVAQWIEVTLLSVMMWIAVSLMLGSYKTLWLLPVNMLTYYVIYVAEYAVSRLYGGETCHEDYRNIEFEKEAYMNQKDADYLKHRKPFAWLLK